jgi:hypothetical protein
MWKKNVVRNLPGGAKKPSETLIQESGSLDRYLSPTFREYEVVAPT